jgi:hypothetical protein
MKSFLVFLLVYTNVLTQNYEINTYFNEIVSKNEFNNKTSINKWNKDVKIFICDNTKDNMYSKGTDNDVMELKTELQKIVKELNDYINGITIEIVEVQDSANFLIYLGSENWYNSCAPKSVNYTKNNLGLFLISKSNNIITKGTMYVDIYRTETINEKKHLLREELTQSLGFFNDSWLYPESIFYQGWTDVTEYSDMDKEIIKMLYK